MRVQSHVERIAKMNDSELQRALRESKAEYKRQSAFVSMQGGWMFWNGDVQEQAELNIKNITAEIKKRQNSNNE